MLAVEVKSIIMARTPGVVLAVACTLFIFKNVSSRNISVKNDQYMLDGKPLQIISGSMHYFRIPSKYWHDRLLKAKAAGLNAISTYVEWNFHEPEERQYRFDGDYDVAEYIRLAQEMGLLVLLRPGPYICAERDLGGLPYWLFSKYPYIQLRTTDKDFIAETKIWIAKLFSQLKPLLYGNGGPIILVQIENEYGSYGSDMAYKKQVRDIIKKHVGCSALLYTTDGAGEGYIKHGYVPGAITTIDFGAGQNNEEHFKMLRKFMPKGPLQDSEYYTGWLTHWGERFSRVDTNAVVKSLEDMIQHKRNVNLYVFTGGTNFGFSSGANTAFKPVITSYDFDAPLSEAGDMTHKYEALRELMIKYHPEIKNITPPSPTKKGAYGKVVLNMGVKLLSEEGRSKMGKRYSDVTGFTLPTFERLRQRAGLVLYETTLTGGGEGTLEIKQPRDRIYVYLDREYKGLIDRESGKHKVILNTKQGSLLSLLVENQGRINYGYFFDVKGIVSNVTFNQKVLDGKWKITGYPLEKHSRNIEFTKQSLKERGPILFEGNLLLPKGQEPLDTFLNTTGWGKGYMWLNGHNLGRYWPGRGPQVTLYVPGVWLRRGVNRLHLLELELPHQDLSLTFIDHPILDRTVHTSNEILFGRWHEQAFTNSTTNAL